MECKSTFQQMVVLVFHDVDSSDVRKQRGSFADAVARHKERYKDRGMEGEVERWRAALMGVANLSGWDLQIVDIGLESKFVEKIVEDISNKLNLPCLNVANYPVGVQSHAQQVNMLLSLGSDDVCMVEIWRIGGIVKTAVTKAFYGLTYLQFEGINTIENYREISNQTNGLVGLQQQVLSNILVNENLTMGNVDQGIEVKKQRLWWRRVPVVLTDKYECLLKLLEVDGIYIPELLEFYRSLQLFCWHALRKDHATEDYVGLSWGLVGYVEGIPLVFEVLGSFFIDKSMLELKRALERLKVISHDDIQEKLRLSFDSINDEENGLFFDIACFLVGMDKNYTNELSRGYCFFPEIRLRVLSSRYLVRIDGDWLKILHMFYDIAGAIACKVWPDDPGKHNRLWFHENILYVLTNHMGTEVVKGLIFNLPRSNDVRGNERPSAKMDRLRLLRFNYVHLRGGYEHLFKRLVWFCWFGFLLKSLLSNLFTEKVVVIDMHCSCLKQVWKERKILSKLKILCLCHLYHLPESLEFSAVTNLEMLLVNDCARLVNFHRSIECLAKLAVLDLMNCKNLRTLPLGFWKLICLQDLSLFGCSKLEEQLGFKGSPSKSWFSPFSFQPEFKESLSKSWFSPFSIWAFPVRIADSIGPSPNFVHGLNSLKRLDLANCNLSYVPPELGSLISLKWLNLQGNIFCTLPTSISHLSRLRDLYLSQCTSLQSLPELPVNLKIVDARRCTSLERIAIGSDFRKSPFLYFPCCHKLVGNVLASNFGKGLLQNQEVSAVGGFSILFPGGDFPDYFNYQTVESVLSFAVPDRKIRGWTLCVVIAGCVDKRVAEPCALFAYPLLYEVKNKTKGVKRHYGPAFHDRLLYRQDHMWLHYAPQHCLELQMEAGDEVEYLVFITDHTQIPVKKCGVNLVYEEDEKDHPSNDQAMIPCATTSSWDVILDHDVSADEAATSTMIVRQSNVRVPFCMSFCLLCLCAFFVYTTWCKKRASHVDHVEL